MRQVIGLVLQLIRTGMRTVPTLISSCMVWENKMKPNQSYDPELDDDDDIDDDDSDCYCE